MQIGTKKFEMKPIVEETNFDIKLLLDDLEQIFENFFFDNFPSSLIIIASPGPISFKKLNPLTFH